MSSKRIVQICRIYAVLVSTMTLYSILVFTKCLPYIGVRNYELALGRAQDAATLFGLLSVVAGIMMSFVWSWHKIEPPRWFVIFVCLAIVAFFFNLVFLPPIAVA